MLGKVKKWLGVEGVKIALELAEEYSVEESTVEGTIIFSTMHEQEVDRVEVKVIERYKRGKNKKLKIDEYLIGKKEIIEKFVVTPDEDLQVPFIIEVHHALSEMDHYSKNILLRPFVVLARWRHGVSSSYKIVASCRVVGTKFNPEVERELKFK